MQQCAIWIIGHIFAIDIEVPHFDAPSPFIPANIRINVTSPETRGIVLPDGENRTILSLFVWTQYRSVTDGQTDRIALGNTALCMASHTDAL